MENIDNFVRFCRQPANPTNKQTAPEDMDALCKLLVSDFKVKDDQDYIIDEIVAAFDRQNFTNKGFLENVRSATQISGQYSIFDPHHIN